LGAINNEYYLIVPLKTAKQVLEDRSTVKSQCDKKYVKSKCHKSRNEIAIDKSATFYDDFMTDPNRKKQFYFSFS
jgi:hypothetical protein